MLIARLTPTLLSIAALGFSGYSLYESALRAPELSIYVAPRIDYTDPDRPEAVREVFMLPITVANDGARTGTVLAMTLEVRNPRTRAAKTFYAARLGTWGEKPLRPFAPAVLVGRATYTQAVQFEPRRGETVARILDQDGGKYEITLTAETVGAPGFGAGRTPQPSVSFEAEIDPLDYRYFDGTGTMEMRVPGYRAPSSTTR